MSRGWILISLVALLAAFPGLAAAQTDTTPPELTLHQPTTDDFTYYQQPAQVFFSGDVVDPAEDDGVKQTRIEITIYGPDADGDGNGDVAGYHDLGLQDDGSWYFNTMWGDDPVLVHGVEYDAVVVATDDAGNTDEAETSFLADGVAPDYTITEAPTETTDSTPRIAGTATIVPGDLPFLTAVATQPSPGGGEIGVASVKLDIVDGQFAGELEPKLPPGDYTLRLTRLDQAMNATLRFRPLRILPAPEPVTPADDPSPPEQEQPPPPNPLESRSFPPPFETGVPVDPAAATAGALAVAARGALSRRRIRQLLARGVAVRFTAGQPGVASIQLLRGRRVVARGSRSFGAAGPGTIRVRATAAGRRALRRAGRARLTLRVTFAPVGGAPAGAETPLTLRR